jgi:hypothetical protein
MAPGRYLSTLRAAQHIYSSGIQQLDLLCPRFVPQLVPQGGLAIWSTCVSNCGVSPAARSLGRGRQMFTKLRFQMIDNTLACRLAFVTETRAGNYHFCCMTSSRFRLYSSSFIKPSCLSASRLRSFCMGSLAGSLICWPGSASISTRDSPFARLIFRK